jgi:hypothetical protein
VFSGGFIPPLPIRSERRFHVAQTRGPCLSGILYGTTADRWRGFLEINRKHGAISRRSSAAPGKHLKARDG